ncbi:MAG: HEAT repeat domain-containing protein [Deltaproteobacteria bacterium]|nr:HEAT repeat domain-containing protein [Deltaproteobacteria bacterium]
MTRRDPAELRTMVLDRGFTPGVRDVPALFDLLADADEDVADGALNALVRLQLAVLPAALERFPAATPPARARLLWLVHRVGRESEQTLRTLEDALDDRDPATRRRAARALGKRPGPRAEEALLRAWNTAAAPELRRTLADALGKIGGPRALEALRDAPDDDALSQKVAARARLMLERTAGRAEPSRIDASVAPERPLPIAFFCRAGLEEVLAEELGAAWQPRIVARGRVEAVLHGTLESAWRARTALSFAFPLEPQPLGAAPDAPADGVVRALTGDAAFALLRRFTAGAIRWRLAFARGGHRRALVWECARRVAERRPELRNDPTNSTWEAVVLERRGAAYVDLFPRGLADPRFAWRVADVPAASHPTLAAALARLGGLRDDDVVWDPVAGSGAELIERALLGRSAALLGTDTDARALDAAERNAAAAGVAIRLERADGTTFVPPAPPTLIMTNPPMGRRTAEHRDLGQTLERFVVHAARVLAPGGRMVWISPRPDVSRRLAEEHGLSVDLDREVDMGGFTARLQRFRRTRG